jgi:hypothetical protein
MGAMSPWKPADLMALTPLQLMCIGSDKPPMPGAPATLEDYQRALAAWGDEA